MSILSRLGYDVCTVSCGLDAISFIQSQPADLVLLDMIMDPGIDGLETYQRILEINPGQKAIIVSGFSETERVRKARALGASAYVRKPYRMESIGLAMRGALKNRLKAEDLKTEG
jgi:DNA-binding NtrC family response regulator